MAAAESEPQDTSEPEAPASAQGAEEIEAFAFRDYTFSEGLAWIMAEGNPAVIDSNGQVQFVVDISEAKAGGAVELRTTPFADGASALYDIYGVSDPKHGGFEIYDSAGNVLFSSEDGDDTSSVNLCAAGDGYYLIGKTVKSMTVSENTIYVIDKNGNVLVPEKQVQYLSPDAFAYAGDGIFAGGNGYDNITVVDAINKTIDDTEDIDDGNLNEKDAMKVKSFIRSHGNGETMAVFNGGSSYSEITKNSKVAASIPAYWFKSEDNSDAPYESRESLANGWYDAEGNLVVTAPSFPEGVTYMAMGNFVGDYAPIFLRGVDGSIYGSVVDKTGTALFEPVKINRLDEFTSDKNGTVCIAGSSGNNFYLLKDGTLVSQKEDGLSALPEDTSLVCLYSMTATLAAVNEGIYVDTEYAGSGTYNRLCYTRLNGEVLKIMLPANVTRVTCHAIRKQQN